MFTIRVAAFIISLLLATSAVEASQGWLIALAVLAGLSIFGWPGRASWASVERAQRRRWRYQDGW